MDGLFSDGSNSMQQHDEGGGWALWVVASIFLHLPSKGVWASLGDLPPGMPRRPETQVFRQNKALLSSGRHGQPHLSKARDKEAMGLHGALTGTSQGYGFTRCSDQHITRLWVYTVL